MLSLAFQRFPEVYTGGRAPPALGTPDKERKCGTPPYVYGWIITRHELYEALYGKPCYRESSLYSVYVGADKRLYSMWTKKGYLDNEYNPNSPAVKPLGPKHVVIFMACSDSDAIIKSVMENKTYHANCRAGLGNPKVMEEEPAWFRVGLKDRPKVFSDPTAVESVAEPAAAAAAVDH